MTRLELLEVQLELPGVSVPRRWNSSSLDVTVPGDTFLGVSCGVRGSGHTDP